MKSNSPRWAGSSVDDFITEQQATPSFRLAFAKARTRRLKQALAGAMRSARLQQRLSQTALAKRVRTTQAVISRIENPATPYLPSVEVLCRIATALGVQLEISFVPQNKAAA